jgi:RND family efflux transporter MFP subunit
MNMTNNTNHDKQLIIKTVVMVSLFFLLMNGLMALFSKKKPLALPPPSVVIQQPKESNITEYITQTGNTVAYQSVDLVARVEGYLEKIAFTDGTFVNKGTALFLIEPLPYLEQVKAALASVAAQKAAYHYSMAEYDRQKRMYKQNATSLNNVEIWSARSQENKAGIDKAIANAAIANINYSYTSVLAPFDGRMGRHLVDVGNLVGNGTATHLATIEQVAPIYVYINLNELDVIKIRNAARAIDFKPKDIHTVPVYVRMQNETTFSHEGKLDFANTGLNASTGTLEFRALLPNQDVALLPGLFVQVRIPIAAPKKELTVPDTAVLYDQIGAYLLVTDQKNNVMQKRVILGSVEQGRRVIKKGLGPHDHVIVSGIQNAIPGHPVLPVQHETKPL